MNLKCYLVGEIQVMGMRVDHDCGLAVASADDGVERTKIGVL